MFPKNRFASTGPFATTSRRTLRAAAFTVCLLALVGCGPKRLKSDFRGFESSFAETSNHEVLLNLARLQNRDPTYFFKLGQITSTYKMQASIAGTGNYVIQGTGAGGNAVGGGTTGVGYENDPVFTFIPVNDDTNAQLLLKPVPAETFYILFQQGWRVDQLFRLMVDRIELGRPQPNGDCVVETVRNVPPQNYVASGPDGELLSGYVTFLRISGLVHVLQKQGYLLLRGTTQFVPFDAAAGAMKAPPAGDHGVAPSASDIEKAAQDGSTWRQNPDGRWMLGKQVPGLVFYLNPPLVKAMGDKTAPRLDPVKTLESELSTHKEWDELGSRESRHEVLEALRAGFSIESGAAVASTQTGGCPTPHLIMRSLLGVMSAAAQEQISFDALKEQNPEVPQTIFMPADTYGADKHFLSQVPSVERLPALRLEWSGIATDTAPLVKVDYRGHVYEVADAKDPDAPENKYWNRDMFRLLSQLQSQVTVDISKFPLPAVLQFNIQ